MGHIPLCPPEVKGNRLGRTLERDQHTSHSGMLTTLTVIRVPFAANHLGTDLSDCQGIGYHKDTH